MRRRHGILALVIGCCAAGVLVLLASGMRPGTTTDSRPPANPKLPETKPMTTFTCASCGQTHEGLVRTFAFLAPEAYFQVPEDERDDRVRMTDDSCIIDEQQFFFRGLIEIPIIGSDDRFAWSVWVSISEKDYMRSGEIWEQPGRESEPPQAGRLSNSIPIYPETLNLKANVHTRPVGQRPFVELEPTEHPLAREQREGISRARVEEINSALHHLMQ